MTFKPSVQSNTTNPETQNTSSYDYSAMQEHVIEQAKTQDKHRTIVGFIGGYYSLGKQAQEPYRAIYDESAKDFERMKKAVEDGQATVEKGNIYIDNAWHNDVMVYSKPKPDREAIALGIFFPQITVDKAQFQEEGGSDPRPLMLLMGGESFVEKLDGSGKKEKVIQYPTFIQETTNNPSGTWGLGQSTTLHKMGLALDLLNEHNLMKVDRLGEMLGRPLQFKMRVWNKPTKNGGTWYTEEVKFVGEVPEGLPIPDFDEKYIHGINFDTPNDEETVKHLRSEIVNTIKRASNFKGSVIEKELEEYRSQSNTETSSEQKDTNIKDEDKPSQNESQAAVDTSSEPVIEFDEDSIPF